MNKFPDKLFVNEKDADTAERIFTATDSLEKFGKDGDMVAVYRKVYTRKLRVKVNLALRSEP